MAFNAEVVGIPGAGIGCVSCHSGAIARGANVCVGENGLLWDAAKDVDSELEAFLMHGVAEWTEAAAAGGGGEPVWGRLILSPQVDGVAERLRHGDIFRVLQVPALINNDVLPAELLQLS